MKNRIIVELKQPLQFIIVTDDYIKKCNTLLRKNDRELLRYLNSGFYFAFNSVIEKDLFLGEMIDNKCTLRTDGLCVWSADLNFYTENHNFIWPTSFVNNVVKNKQINLYESDFIDIRKKYIRTINKAMGYPMDSDVEGVLEYSVIYL